MDHIQKFLRKLQPSLRAKIIETLLLIGSNNLDTLDIAAIKGKTSWFRCRVGSIRIVFIRTQNKNIVIDIQYRGGGYKDL